MEANKAVKIRAQKQDVVDLSQVGSNECPQGKAVEAPLVCVSLHARDKCTSNQCKNKQHINMANFRITEGTDADAAITKIMGYSLCSLCVCAMPIK
jgi:hypothetical protein